jgi:hypothetical protein
VVQDIGLGAIAQMKAEFKKPKIYQKWQIGKRSVKFYKTCVLLLLGRCSGLSSNA